MEFVKAFAHDPVGKIQTFADGVIHAAKIYAQSTAYVSTHWAEIAMTMPDVMFTVMEFAERSIEGFLEKSDAERGEILGALLVSVGADAAIGLGTAGAGYAGLQAFRALKRSEQVSKLAGVLKKAERVEKAFSKEAKRESKLLKFAKYDDRIKILEAVTNSDGSLKLSKKVEKQLHGVRHHIPNQAILEAIGSGKRIPDPQNVANHFMYSVEASYSNGRGVLEVLIDETSGQIRHVLYRSYP